MKPLSFARRGARWLMAAGVAVAMLPAMPAHSEDAVAAKDNKATLQQSEPADSGPTATANPDLRLQLENPRTIQPAPGAITPFFTKTGKQIECDYVVYDIRFGLRGDPKTFANPALADSLKNIHLDFRDTLPPGLSITSVTATGDGTDAGGGPLPTPAVSTSINPNDFATISDFRLSAADLDGAGAADERTIDIKIVAKIDRSAFPAATMVDNQAFVKFSADRGFSVEMPSQDPGKPDDGSYLTGEKTSILVDVTHCQPPPPPNGGGSECFKADTGTVDCVPGGGAFIYHLPVGPDMAGKWVQLTTTTPGITISPDTQEVPAGGGVLDWQIDGALPGDVIHIVVTGINSYAGPEEGVGLCCTQTIDIVIPPDLKCPPKDKYPKLKIEKFADVPRCTLAGGCDFTITVTNVGDAPFNGPIVLNEVTTPGNAPVVSGPNAPWTCVPMVSPMSCSYPATTLNPGDSVTLKLGFAPGGGWDWNYIRNCASINYQQMDKDQFHTKLTKIDRACAEIPICKRGDPDCEPPHEKKVDLILKKRPRSEICTADGVCYFIIDIINNGTNTYNGPLTFTDTYPTGAPTSSDFIPSPPWSCGPTGANLWTCNHPGISLAPGASTPIGVKVVVPSDYPGDMITNCAEVQAIPGETDLTNNKACASERIRHKNPGKPELRITKTCGQSTSLAAVTLVSCRITVTNVGTAAPTGPVHVSDAATMVGGGTPVPVQTVTPDGPEWSCGPVPANTLSCDIPGAVMTPGTSRYFDVTVANNGEFQNCATGSYGPAPGDDVVYPVGKACANGGGRPDIRVEKTGDTECQAGKPCTFEITITNDGNAPFSGPMRIGDAIGVDGLGRLDGVPISEISPPFGCSPEPTALPISCIATLTLGAHESQVHQVTVVIPDDGTLANLPERTNAKNCVGVVPPEVPVVGVGDGTLSAAAVVVPKSKNYDCHPFTIIHEVKKLCSDPLVMNAAGACVCPDGSTFRNGTCVPNQDKPKQCKYPGQVHDADGNCVCRVPGYEVIDGACRKPPKECKLLPGQIHDANGNCVCRDPKAEVIDGECRRPPKQCTLLPGQIHDANGNCVCRVPGYVVIDGACRKPQKECTLLPGQIHDANGNCVCRDPKAQVIDGACRRPPLVCRKGMHPENGVCVKDRPKTCDIRGQIVNANGDCVCRDPKAQVIDGACRRPPLNCKDGTHQEGNSCVPDKPKGCSIRGQIVNANGDCVCRDPKAQVIDGACRRPPLVCREGTHPENGQCVKDKPKGCRIPGQIADGNGNCVCRDPKAQVIDGACRQPHVIRKLECPDGTVGVYPDCSPKRRKPTLEITPNLINPDVIQKLTPRRKPQVEIQQNDQPNGVRKLLNNNILKLQQQ